MLHGSLFILIILVLLIGKGTFTWSSGTTYSGDFYCNRITGKGRYDWPDFSWYEGDVVNGIREGEGEFESPDGEARYNG